MIVTATLLLAIRIPAYSQKLFTELPSDLTRVNFKNTIREDSVWNFFRYMNFYNGGGVSIGDINNDQLPDIYFTANQQPNRLFLNQGKFQFKDITLEAGVSGNEKWTTGSTMADVNGDGLLDIYICHAGHYANAPELQNELFINQGNNTFKEAAEEMGVADMGRSVHASFFDYDLDGDLDLFVVNHPNFFHAPIEQRLQSERGPHHPESDHLYRNDDGKFVDVTDAAGVMNWAFGLSVVTSDLNNDGYPDIYVACDYSEPDYYWINNGDGTFRNGLFESFLHISNFSMGSDAGDFNNDGNTDLVVLDMMAKDNRRKKTNMSGMNPDAFWDNVENGRHYQYMQNVLQMNNGNGTFSDVGELAGISTTDWSWSPLLADFDNDGWLDLFISNGMRREVRDNDYSKQLIGKDLELINKDWKKLTDEMPVEKVPNFCFSNNGDLSFEDVSNSWGLNKKGFSTGAAYGDLDGDGDLDLVLNNVDDQASIFRNNSNPASSLKIVLIGPDGNRHGFGTKVTLHTSNGIQFRELISTRGFQSSSEPVVHFGIDAADTISRIEVKWPDGRIEDITSVKAGGLITADYKNSGPKRAERKIPTQIFQSVTSKVNLRHSQTERFFDDYKQQILLPHTYSQNGPFMSTGDVNGDGLDDLFVGGPAGQAGQLFLQTRDSGFVKKNGQTWEGHKGHEDMGSAFFDADGDGDLDLYVVSGSVEFEQEQAYHDRLYFNDGTGVFTWTADKIPLVSISGSRVKPADFDQDGDVDLLVLGRIFPAHYPTPVNSMLLKNEGGVFYDATADIAPELHSAGMCTDAVWFDYDGDGDLDIALAGEWAPIKIFKNESGSFTQYTDHAGISKHVGWWYSIAAEDMDGDGDLDLVAGNLGLNTKYKGTFDNPFEIYANDYDRNGTTEIVLGFYEDGKCFPVRGRQCSSDQLPAIKQKFPSYNDFSVASINDIYGLDIEKDLHFSATWMSTSYFENKGDGTFAIKALPNLAQLSAVNAIVIDDVNDDGNKDIIVAGNMFNAEVETCRHDASVGMVLLGDGKGEFEAMPTEKSGFFAQGDVKDMATLKTADGETLIIISRNNSSLRAFKKR